MCVGASGVASSVVGRDSVTLLQYLNGDVHHRIQSSFVACCVGWHLPAGVSCNQPPCGIAGRALDHGGVPYVILVTKYHRLSGLGDKIYFLAVPEVGKSKITVLASSAPGEGSRPGPQAAASPCVLT